MVPASISILPTILDLVNIDPGGLKLDGTSLLRHTDRPFFAETHFHYNSRHLSKIAMIYQDEKLIFKND